MAASATGKNKENLIKIRILRAIDALRLEVIFRVL